MKSSKKIVAMTIVVLLLSTTVVYASVTLPYWYADYTPDGIYNVGYWEQNMPYCVSNLSDEDATFSSYFVSAVNNAVTQWDAVLDITLSGTSANYALTRIYGGTISELDPLFPELAGGEAGLTVYWTSAVDETVFANALERYVFTIDSAKMCVVNDGYNLNQVKNIALHELGHTLGWFGHSSSSSRVMYHTCNSVTTLTSYDKNHLKQVYDAF